MVEESGDGSALGSEVILENIDEIGCIELYWLRVEEIVGSDEGKTLDSAKSTE